MDTPSRGLNASSFGLSFAISQGNTATSTNSRRSTAPMVALRLRRMAVVIRRSADAAPPGTAADPAGRAGRVQGGPGPGVGLAGGGDPGNGHRHGRQAAVLVRGSSSAVATSAIRIATSTATVISRNSACISGKSSLCTAWSSM